MNVSGRQIRTLRRQIRNVYGHSYIPVTTATNTLSIGDILRRRHDTVPRVDGSMLDVSDDDLIVGPRINRHFMTSSSVSVDFKAAGRAQVEDLPLDLAKAGLVVRFSKHSSMFLKVRGFHEQTTKDYGALRDEFLQRYASGGVGRVYVVHGLVRADQFFLQFGSNTEGTVGIELEAGVDQQVVDLGVALGFSVAWKTAVGFGIDAPDGGVLGYRVAKLRYRPRPRRLGLSKSMLERSDEIDVLDELPTDKRRELVDEGTLELEDCTDELLLEIENAVAEPDE